MKHKSLLVVPLLGMSLASCGNVTHYAEHLEDYQFTMEYHDDFNILQLTDIHWNVNTSTNASKTYLSKVIKETDAHIKAAQGSGAKIDLIEITGDLFMLANSKHVLDFIAYFEEIATQYDTSYAVLWGNHDRHGIYNANWLSKQFLDAPHCLYLEPDNDDLYGRSNFVINLKEGTTTKWQIANLDSGASISENTASIGREYDYIRDDQVEWWKAEHDDAGSNVPTIAYYHIPQTDNQKAYEAVMDGSKTYKNKFFRLEGFGSSKGHDSKFLEVGRANNLKGAFMGHAHNNDWTVDIDGVVVGLGVKSGSELYYAHVETGSGDAAMEAGLASVGITENFDLIGASLVTITEENPASDSMGFDLEHLYLNERASGDFVRWVKF